MTIADFCLWSLGLIIISTLVYLAINYKFVLLCAKVPTLSPWCVIKYTLLLKSPEDMTNVASAVFKRFGDVVLSWYGPFKTIVTRDPELASAILMSPSCKEKSFAYRGIIKYTDDGVLTCEYDKWVKIRKVFCIPVKKKEHLLYLPTINNNADDLKRNLSKLVGLGDVSLDILIKRTIMKNSAETFTAKDIRNPKVIPVHEFDRGLILLTDILMKPWLLVEMIAKRCVFWKDFKNVTTAMREYPRYLFSETHRTSRPCTFLNTAYDLISRNEIDRELFIGSLGHFFVGSYDTTAETLFNVLYMLAAHPEIQEKVHQEITSVLPEDRDLQLDELNHLIYLEMVINETMRLFPPIPFVGRLATDGFVFNGLQIPKGMHFLISLFHVHRNEKYWGPHADQFNPDNFLAENVKDRNNNAFIPFAKGPRNCLGWRNGYVVLKIMLAKILREFKFATKFKYEDLRFIVGISLHLKVYPKMVVMKRG